MTTLTHLAHVKTPRPGPKMDALWGSLLGGAFGHFKNSVPEDRSQKGPLQGPRLDTKRGPSMAPLTPQSQRPSEPEGHHNTAQNRSPPSPRKPDPSPHQQPDRAGPHKPPGTPTTRPHHPPSPTPRPAPPHPPHPPDSMLRGGFLALACFPFNIEFGGCGGKPMGA